MIKKELPKWLKKESFLGKIFRYIWKSLLVYLILSGLFHNLSGDFGLISGVINSFKKLQPSDFSTQVSQSFEDAESCIFDDSEWITSLGQLQKREDGLYLLASTTQSSSLQYERSLSSGSEICFSFVLLSGDSPNVVILVHDLFEVVVGDDSNRRVTVKANLIEGKPMSFISADNEDNNSFLLPEKILIGREISIKIKQQPLSMNRHELILNITYDPMKDPIVKSYHFPIPPEFKVSDKPIRVSIGIINTDNEEDILIRFKYFKISLDDLNPDLTRLDF